MVNGSLTCIALTSRDCSEPTKTTMTSLTPLIELATQKSLDVFFRVGQGYVARTVRDAGLRQSAFGLSPLGVQSRAEARIICTLASPSPDAQLYAWPGGQPKGVRLVGSVR